MDASARSHREQRPGAGAAGECRYVRHRPEHTVLYQVLEQHVGPFFDHLSEQGASLPGFVRGEFDDYLRCGRLEAGLLRVKCTACRHEHVVAFSCRKRGFCPSCGARRMVDGAAYLVDHVLPHVPMRQWVVTFPWPLRLLFAARPALLTRVLGVVTRALSTSVLRRAGLTVRSGAKTGIFTAIQRFGSNLGLNVHLHMLAPDGAYSFEQHRPRFHRIPAPSRAELERLLDTLIRRVTRTLMRAGVLVEDPVPGAPGQPYLDLEPDSSLDQLSAAAVRYRIVVGPLAGRRTMTLHDPTMVAVPSAPSKPFTVSRDGFSLNASVACQSHQRDRLERVCRYLLRPPVALERLSVDGDGLVVYELKHPYADGTTHVLFEPLDFIARLAALVPRPRGHLLRYHGLFAPRARHRHRVVPEHTPPAVPGVAATSPAPPSTSLGWMQRLRRAFGIDVSRCPRCGAPLRVLAHITDPRVIARIIEHLAARDAAPHIARAPP